MKTKKRESKLPKVYQIIFDNAVKNKSVTQVQIAKKLKITPATVWYYINQLKKMKRVKYDKNGLLQIIVK